MINIHAIINPVISMLMPNVKATLYRSTGQVNVMGEIKQTYAAGESVEIQIQSEGPTTLNHVNKVGQEEVTRRFFMNSAEAMSDRVAGIVRPETRNGDMIQIDAGAGWYAGTWWLVLGPTEDATRAGWQSVRATMQVIPPAIEVQDG